MALRVNPTGLVLATTLGLAGQGIRPSVLVQPAAAQNPVEEPSQEFVVSAARQTDAALTAQVVGVLQNDPYVFAGHISVVSQNGTVTLRGVVQDLGDLHRALQLARRIAGRGRVVDRLELIPADSDAD